MVSTSQVVNDIIKKTPSLETVLASGIVNYSSLARMLKPQVKEKLFRENIKEGAIIMALKRATQKLKKDFTTDIHLEKYLGNITLRSNLVDYTFTNSQTIISAQNKLLEKYSARKDLFLTISHGVSQVTIIAGSSCEKDIKEIFKKETVSGYLSNLSSLTIEIRPEATKMIGIYYSILKLLVWEKISFVDLISTFTELTILMETKYIEKAFSVLNNI